MSSTQMVKEGLAIFVMEGRQQVGVMAVIRKDCMTIVQGITALPIQKRDSVPSLRSLIGELPASVQQVVRDYAKNAKSTMTQDSALVPVLLRTIEVPKADVLKFTDVQCISFAELAKAHPKYIPHRDILKQACMIE